MNDMLVRVTKQLNETCTIGFEARGDEHMITTASRDFYKYVLGEKKKENNDISYNNDIQENESIPLLCTRSILRKSWKKISELVAAGQVREGDSVYCTLNNGESVEFIITDDSDDYVRFDSKDCVGGKEVPWNEDGGTEGGYPASDVKEYLETEIWDLLPDDLKDVIVITERKTLVDGKETTFETRVFLPSASEVFDKDDCYGDKGLYEQLPYYKDRRHRMKRTGLNGEEGNWWVASVHSGHSANACAVSNSGYASTWDASSAARVPVCFRIKKS